MHFLPMNCGETLEIDLPLDPETDSSEDVSRLVAEFLRDIDACHAEREVSAADVLQALSITTVVHLARAEAQRRSAGALNLPFIDAALSAAPAPPRAAATA